MKERGTNLHDAFERNGNFGKNVTVYLTDKNLDYLRKILRERKYTTKDTGVDYRTISHWQEMKLLPKSVYKQHGWKKLTLFEVIWIRAISQSREYGFSLDKISKARDEIEWKELESLGVSILEYYTALALATDSDPYILLLPDGQAEIATTYEIFSRNFFDNETDLLMISIKSILRKLKFNVPKSNLLHELTTNEESLLQSIRYEGNKEINIHLKEGVIKELTTTKTYDKEPNLKGSIDFAEVINRYTGGQKRSTEVKVKKRFK